MILDKVKVFIITDNLGTGGAQRQIVEYLKCANRNRFNIKVINLDRDYNVWREEIQKLGYEVIGIKHQGFFNIRTIFKLIKLFRSERPQIVYSYLFTSDCYGRLAAKLAGVPVIISSVRSIDLWKKFHHIIADRILAKFTDKIIINAENIRPFLVEKEKINPEKIIRIYNGIDLDRFCNPKNPDKIKEELGIPQDASVIGMVARFSEQKDYKTFFESAKLVSKEIPHAYFLAIGDGPLKESLQSTVRRLHIENRVIFTGLREDIPDLINSFDIGILASHYEGCSNVIMEYMASAKAVIASDVGGNSELVIDGVTGYIVPPKNPEVMSERILFLLKNRELKEKMGRAGKIRIKERFTVGNMAKNIERLFEELLKIKGIKEKAEFAFIISQFPEMHETFILRELKAIKERGVKFKIFSLKRCKDKVVHSDARPFLDEVDYIPFLLSRKIISANFKTLIKNPLRYMIVLLEIIVKNIKSFKSLWQSIAIFPKSIYYARQIKRLKVKHIQAHWATIPATSAYIASRFSNVAYGITAHAWDIFLNSPMLKEKLQKAKFIITCTDYNRRYLQKMLNRVTRSQGHKVTGKNPKIYLNYHGLEKEWFRDIVRHPPSTVHGPFRILAIGRLVEQKGFEYLIWACKFLKDKDIDFECKIVGEGPLKNSLQSMVHSQQLKDYIKFLGLRTQDEIKKLYREASIFVAPSVIAKNGDRDGIPNVILEAMARGLAVVATDVSGLREVVFHKKTGLVIPAGNPQALSQAIEELMQNKKLRDKLGEEGRKYVLEHFDLDKNINSLIKIFEKNIAKQKIKVLYLIWALERGGAERVVIELAKHINREKFAPYVCCINQPGLLSEELRKLSIPIFHLNKKRRIELGALRKLVNIIKENDFDIIHTHMFTANLWGRLANIFAGNKPVIITEHNIDEWKNYLYFLIDWILLFFTRKIIFVSHKVRLFYERKIHIPGDMSLVCHNGVDTSRLLVKSSREKLRKSLGIEGETFLIGAIGRLVPQKDFQNFLHAFFRVKKEKENIKAIIVGDGPQREDLVRLRDELGLFDSVKFLGMRSDIADILNSIDLLIVASKREGLSVSILEAMAMGVVVVATDVGGNSECIIDRRTGLLVPPEDPEALSRTILKAISDKRELEAMGIRAKEFFKEHFTVDKMIKMHEKLYESVVGELLFSHSSEKVLV